MIRTSSLAPRAAAFAPAALLAAVSLLAACGAEPRGSPSPAPFADLQRHALHIGLEESGPASAALGHVIAARVTEGGEHVVVLDFVAPYVKVFDARGHLRTAFLQKGGGPAEARQPTTIAVEGDSLVLVGSGTREVSVFTLDGELRARARLPGVLPLAAASSCPGEWLLYGPRPEPRLGRGVVSWLHRVRFVAPDSVEVTSVLDDAIPPRIPAGIPYGLVADGEGALVRHTLGARPRLLRVPCAGGQPRVLHEGAPLAQAEPVRAGEGMMRTSVVPGMRAPGGVAAVEEGVVYGENVFLGRGQSRLDLTLLEGGRERTLSVAGSYVLQDSRPGVGVLVSTSDPVPQVFLLKPGDFRAMFPAR